MTATQPNAKAEKKSYKQPLAVFALTGKVVRVADGESVTILDSGNTQHKIRLQGIDAPERGQPFANASRKHLASLIAGKTVTAEWTKRDRYGRIVSTILVDEDDINLEQVKAGMAV